MLHGVCFDIDFIEINNPLVVVAITIDIAAQRRFAGAGSSFNQIHFSFPEEKILILGDACNNATFLFDENSLTVEEYRENLLQIQNRLEGRFDTTCLCHHVIWASKDMIHSVIEVCDTIMKDQADDVPFNFMGQQAFVAKKANEYFNRLDGVEGNIIYSKEKIRKKEVTP